MQLIYFAVRKEKVESYDDKAGQIKGLVKKYERKEGKNKYINVYVTYDDPSLEFSTDITNIIIN